MAASPFLCPLLHLLRVPDRVLNLAKAVSDSLFPVVPGEAAKPMDAGRLEHEKGMIQGVTGW